MRRAALGFLAVVLLVSSCSLGPREDWADAIHDAPDAAARAGAAKVHTTVAVKVIETNIRQDPKPLIPELDGVVDFRGRASQLAGRGQVVSGAKPAVIFDDLVAYLPRSAASTGRSRQHWARFDFEREPKVDLNDTDRRLAVGAGVLISPALAVEVLEGVLTGSIERVGTEDVGGHQTTHYAGRVSQDAAAREVDDEDRREGALRAFASLGIREDIFPAEVWIDEQGRPRRIRFVMRQQKDRVNAFELRAAWEFSNYGVDAKIVLPGPADTVESRRMANFVVQFIREQI
jgi:hypothetical protein